MIPDGKELWRVGDDIREGFSGNELRGGGRGERSTSHFERDHQIRSETRGWIKWNGIKNEEKSEGE